MSIIICPNCDKPGSSRIRVCPYCGYVRGQAGEAELREHRRRKLRDRVYHLKMASYSVITLFLAAFTWYWIDTDGFQHQSTAGPVILLAITSVAYLSLRVLLYQSIRVLRKLGS